MAARNSSRRFGTKQFSKCAKYSISFARWEPGILCGTMFICRWSLIQMGKCDTRKFYSTKPLAPSCGFVHFSRWNMKLWLRMMEWIVFVASVGYCSQLLSSIKYSDRFLICNWKHTFPFRLCGWFKSGLPFHISSSPGVRSKPKQIQIHPCISRFFLCKTIGSWA